MDGGDGGLPVGNDLFRFERCLDFLSAQGVEIAPNSTWLDLGCHQGQFLRMLVRRHVVRAIGFDDWDPALRTPEPGPVWEYRKADLERELPWETPVPFISAFEVLEHMIDTDGFLRRIFDRLEKGGWVLISTPNINSLRNRVTVPLGRYPTGLEYRTVIHHVRLYNVEILTKHLRDTGFERISVRGVAFLPFSSPFGESRLSALLADKLPSLCSNIIAVARKP
ncbi:MAG: class I SAM-dependent methyltransferase [Reyranella sp.]|nr:class I SAM-dependent methyltransferase [Reyranella sp.]